MTLEIEFSKYGKHIATQQGEEHVYWALKNKKKPWVGSLRLDGFDAHLLAYM